MIFSQNVRLTVLLALVSAALAVPVASPEFNPDPFKPMAPIIQVDPFLSPDSSPKISVPKGLSISATKKYLEFNHEILTYLDKPGDDFPEKMTEFLGKGKGISPELFERMALKALELKLPDTARAVIQFEGFPQQSLKGLQELAIQNGKMKASHALLDEIKSLAAKRVASADSRLGQVAKSVANSLHF
jgi:hypothetical protein